MRLSNIFIYGSVTIIVAASLGFLIFKSLPETKTDSDVVATRVKELEQEKQDLLDIAAESTKKYSAQIRSLNDDIQRSSNLLMEKDQEISQLKQQLSAPAVQADTLSVQAAQRLACTPETLLAAIDQVVFERQELGRRLQLLNSQFSNRMTKNDSTDAKGGDSSVKNPGIGDDQNPDGGAPRIKQLELAAPENKWAQRPNQVPPAKQDETGQAETTKEDLVEESDQKNGDADAIEKLAKQVESLEADLKNREKLLMEQTSLIEDLKKKTRVETGFRTGSNEQGDSSLYLPFRDRGTFKVIDR